MAATGTPTPNIGLRRAQGTDPASVDDINYNSALIDTKLGAVGNSSVQDQIDTLNSKFTSLRTANELINKSKSITNSYKYLGESFTLSGPAIVSIYMNYNDVFPQAIGVKTDSSGSSSSVIYAEGLSGERCPTGYGILPAGTYYLWGKAGSNGSNVCKVTAYYLP